MVFGWKTAEKRFNTSFLIILVVVTITGKHGFLTAQRYDSIRNRHKIFPYSMEKYNHTRRQAGSHQIEKIIDTSTRRKIIQDFDTIDLRSTLLACRQEKSQGAIFQNLILWNGTLYCQETLSHRTRTNEKETRKEFVLTTPWLQKGKGSRLSLTMRFLNTSRGQIDMEKGMPNTCRLIPNTSALVGVIHWNQFGHFVYNTISPLYEITGMMNMSMSNPSKTNNISILRNSTYIFAYPDMTRLDPLWLRETATWDATQLIPSSITEGFSFISSHPVASLPSLLARSRQEAFCFSRAIVGLQGAQLDHYNYNVPAHEWQNFISSLGIHFDAKPVPRSERNQTNIVILDRIHTRRIVNAPQVVDLAESVFNQSQARPAASSLRHFEKKSFGEQIRLMARTDVLIGVDGTGLFNGNFMPMGSTVIRIKPFAYDILVPGKSVNFKRLWAALRIQQREWSVARLSQTKPRVSEQDLRKAVMEVMYNNATRARKTQIALTQDSLVDPNEFRILLEEVANFVKVD